MALKLYPALDLLDGKCVRLAQGRFEDPTIYSSDPLEVAARFQAEGAKALHLVDLQGARDPANRQTGLLEKLLKSIAVETQVGGGVRSYKDAAELLELGATRVVIGSLAVQDEKQTQAILSRLGATRVTLALDLGIVDGEPRVAVHGWQKTSELTLERVLARYLKQGLTHLLCTDISRDGMLSGPNLDLYKDLVLKYPQLEIQASGGMKSVDDVRALARAGVPAAILGRSLYQGTMSLKEALAAC